MNREQILKQEFLKFIPQEYGDKKMTSEEFDKHLVKDKRVFDLILNAMDEYAKIKMIEENKSLLEMAKLHMDSRAVLVISERISDVSDSKLFTYEQVHKFLRNFNFQYSWIEPEEFEKWIKDNVK